MSTTDEVRIPGELPLWEVPGWRERFGVYAGVTGRGDDPARPFDLGQGSSRPLNEAVADWRRLLASFPGCHGSAMARQVHGAKVLWHDQLAAGWTVFEAADGHATTRRGHLLLITVADCVPIYLIAPGHGAIALLHAGWRGVAAGMLAAGVTAITSHTGAVRSDIVMHCGVAISGKCYEVGSEVLSSITGAEPLPGFSTPHLDLRANLARQARELGIGEISVSGHCTVRDGDRFFSYRRSKSDGRMVAWLGWPE